MTSLGDPAESAAAGDSRHEPAPEYIADAPEASEEVWAREQALYREKNAGERPA
jgi:hypothetical protein